MVETGFTFNNISSESMDVKIVRVGGRGLASRKYFGGRRILEDHPDNALYPNFYGVKHEPFTFTVTFMCDEGVDMDDTKMYDLANWLISDEYKPFISDDNIGKVYYCMAINDADFITNGLQQGYFTVEFRCRDGFGWTIPAIVTHDLSTITSPTTIQIFNQSNVSEYFYPNMQITLEDSNTAISMVNLSDNSYTFSFTDLSVGEVLEIDNQKRKIESDTVANRFDKFNKNWFKLKKGMNNIQVTGKCTIKFNFSFPIFN